jgi:hypothetical protein
MAKIVSNTLESAWISTTTMPWQLRVDPDTLSLAGTTLGVEKRNV